MRLLICLDRQSAWLAALQLPVLVAVGDAYVDTVSSARETATARLAAAEATDPDAAARARSGRTVAGTVASIFGDDPDRWASMEIAPALRIHEATAASRLSLARALPARLPRLNAALRTGRVSFGHVLLVVRETTPLTDELAREVDAKLARRYATPPPVSCAPRPGTPRSPPTRPVRSTVSSNRRDAGRCGPGRSTTRWPALGCSLPR